MSDPFEGIGDLSDPVIHSGVQIGSGCRIAQFVTIGSIPFTFEKGIPRVRKPLDPKASVKIGDGVEIMSHSNIDRGSVRDTMIGDGTMIDRIVHIAHDSHIGKHCIVVAGTVIGGFAEIEDEVYLGMGVRVLPRVRIGAGSMIGAGAVVLDDVPPGSVMVGNPARFVRLNHPESWYDRYFVGETRVLDTKFYVQRLKWNGMIWRTE